MAPSFDQVAREQVDKLYRLGLGFCGSHADAQDLAQETLVQAFRKWATFEGRADPGTWLYRIAVRTCQRMRRRRAGQPPHLESIDAEPAFTEVLMVDPAALEASDKGDREAGMDRLREGIATLPPAFRLPLVMREIAGLSIEETARALGLKPATVKTRLHRARLILRKQIARSLPQRAGQVPAYPKRLCLDLLHAKQEAMDQGRPLALPEGLICERCRSVFATLDAGQDLCRRLADEATPNALRTIIVSLSRGG